MVCKVVVGEGVVLFKNDGETEELEGVLDVLLDITDDEDDVMFGDGVVSFTPEI